MARGIGIYVRKERKKYGLTEAELGALIGYSANFVGKCERGDRTPPTRFMLGCSILFGRSLSDLFPDFYEAVEEAVGANAAASDALWRNQEDAASLKKMELINGIGSRAKSPL